MNDNYESQKGFPVPLKKTITLLLKEHGIKLKSKNVLDDNLIPGLKKILSIIAGSCDQVTMFFDET